MMPGDADKHKEATTRQNTSDWLRNHIQKSTSSAAAAVGWIPRASRTVLTENRF